MASLFDDEENIVPILPHDPNSINSGAFCVKKGHLVADIRLEFDVENKLFNLYIERLKKFVKECEEVHVLKSSSGI